MEFVIDSLDEASPLFVRIDGKDSVVRYPVLPKDIQEADSGALRDGVRS